MLSSRGWRYYSGWLVDLTALAVAWFFAIFVISIFELIDEFWILLTLCLIPVVNIFWLPIRLAPRMIFLAHRHRREELALTLLPARDYLTEQLKWPFIHALAPTCTTIPLLILPMLVVLKMLSYSELFVILCVFLIAFSFGLAISTAGAFDLLARQCRAKSTGGASCIIIPFIWTGGAFVPSVILLMVFTMTSPSDFNEIMFLLHAVTLLLFAFSLTYAILLWWKSMRSFQRQQQTVEFRDAKIIRASCLLIPLTWSAVAIALPICLILSFIILCGEDLFSLGTEEQVIFSFIFILSILAALALMLAIKRWRKAVEVYYRFD